MNIEKARDLALEHWSYVRGILITHSIGDEEIGRIGHHYVAAFIHGWKHAKEDEIMRSSDKSEEAEKAINALRVIHTWATVDGALDQKDVQKLSAQALGI